MIVDSSALIAVLLAEPGHEPVLEHLSDTETVRVGAPTLVETGIVLVSRTGIAGKSLLARLLEETEADTIQFTDHHWTVAVDAFNKYGKGRHRAALNFGDCLTYAVARLSGEPLLCIGEDFSQTDLPMVIPRGGARAS